MARAAILTGAGVALLSAVAAASSIAMRQPPHPIEARIVEPAPIAQGDRVPLAAAQLQEALASGALDRDVKSILNISKPMRHGDFVWNDKNVPAGRVWIRVDLGSQLISVFRAGHEIGTAVILFGAEDKGTPTGKFPVQWKRKDHHSITYDAPMPYTLRLTDDGVAIHGSDVEWGAATHGCIGVPKEFAKRLFDAVERGDEVLILA